MKRAKTTRSRANGLPSQLSSQHRKRIWTHHHPQRYTKESSSRASSMARVGLRGQCTLKKYDQRALQARRGPGERRAHIFCAATTPNLLLLPSRHQFLSSSLQKDQGKALRGRRVKRVRREETGRVWVHAQLDRARTEQWEATRLRRNRQQLPQSQRLMRGQLRLPRDPSTAAAAARAALAPETPKGMLCWSS
eukprot:4898277-Pleurochrysis_carterae.AAC.6